MFELTKEELENWRSQIVISNRDRMGLRYKPMAFTEHGVAMLSSVLNSDRAIDVNIQIMRAFLRLRDMLATQKQLAQKLGELERKFESHNESIRAIFEAIHQLMTPPEKARKEIGFKVKEKRPAYRKSKKT